MLSFALHTYTGDKLKWRNRQHRHLFLQPNTQSHPTNGTSSRILVGLCFTHTHTHAHLAMDSFVWFCYCHSLDDETQFLFSLSFIVIFHFLLYLLPHGISGKINSDVNLKLNSKMSKHFNLQQWQQQCLASDPNRFWSRCAALSKLNTTKHKHAHTVTITGKSGKWSVCLKHVYLYRAFDLHHKGNLLWLQSKHIGNDDSMRRRRQKPTIK